MKDNYFTLESECEGFFKDRASKFIAYAAPVLSTQECQEFLNRVKKEHFKARHHCFAYEIGHEGLLFRAADDGEPSGTAGKPILGQIRSHELKNVMVIVVRYFGGTKLGTSGLINAYKEATKDAFQQGNIITKVLKDHYYLEFGYELMSQVMQATKMPDIDVISKDFEEVGRIKFAIPQSISEENIIKLRAIVEGKRVEEINIEDEVEGYVLDYKGVF